MPKTLLFNHLSAEFGRHVASNAREGKKAFMLFYRTVQSAVKEYGFEKFIVTDKPFWELSPSSDCSLTDFINDLSPTNQRWVYELHRLSCRSVTDFFSEDLIDRLTTFTPKIENLNASVEYLACAACMDGVVAVSFSTNSLWRQTILILNWYDGDKLINFNDYDLKDKLYNISSPDTIPAVLDCFSKEDIQITRAYWADILPTTCVQDTFWDWFDGLAESIQKNFFKVVCTIQEKKWLARKSSSFQRLVGNELCEIRCWPSSGETIRGYVKVESTECVVFLNGSGKKDQDSAIERAVKFYAKYKTKTAQ